MGVVAKRSSMIFYSGVLDHYSHRVRIVLAEKGVTVDVVALKEGMGLPADIAQLNPYGSLPTLVDRDLVLYESTVMMEYLDERFPHPPLLPVYPVARAHSRLWIYRIKNDWEPIANQLLKPDASLSAAELAKLRAEFRASIEAVAPIFEEKPYFMSEEFTLVDCCVAPILWRLPAMGLEIKKDQAPGLHKYMKRLFSREAFKASLSDEERVISNEMA